MNFINKRLQIFSGALAQETSYIRFAIDSKERNMIGRIFSAAKRGIALSLKFTK